MTIEGVNVHFPTRGLNSRFTDAEKYILAGLKSDWIKQSLTLIKESYGIDFNEYDVTVDDINFKFENTDDDTLAYVRHCSSYGEINKLNLVVNMKYYNNIDMTSEVRAKTHCYILTALWRMN